MNAAINYRADIKREKGDPILAVVYARYSSHSQTDQSIEGQLAAAQAYAAQKGYTIIREYCDRAVSGRTDNRDEFQRMLADTDKRQFDVIITWKIDRIGRNREDIAFNKHRCKKNGVKIEYVAENLPDSAESIILEGVLEAMAEYYSVQLSTNVKRGIRESAKKGMFHGGTIPLGYKINRDTKKYEVDPVTAPIVQTIFDKYARGNTEVEIITWLNEKGVKTSRNKPFGKSSLLTILHNEKYIGVYAYQDIRLEDAIPAIVEKGVFEKVQRLMTVNQRAPSHKWTYMDFLLSDRLFCGHCGENMIGVSGVSRNGTKHGYYQCRKQRRKACDKKPCKKEWIEKKVLYCTMEILSDDSLIEFIADQTFVYYQKTKMAQTERHILEDSLTDINKRIENIMGAIEMGIYNATTKSKLDELEARKAEIAASIAEYDLTSGLKLTRDQILYFLLQFRNNGIKDDNCKKRLIQTFVNSVFLYDDGKIKIVFNYTGDNNTVTLKDIDTADAAIEYSDTEAVKTGLNAKSVLLPQGIAHHKRTLILIRCQRPSFCSKVPENKGFQAIRLFRKEVLMTGFLFSPPVGSRVFLHDCLKNRVNLHDSAQKRVSLHDSP